MSEYRVSFIKGSRIGARSGRSVTVEASSRLEAISKAQKEVGPDFTFNSLHAYTANGQRDYAAENI